MLKKLLKFLFGHHSSSYRKFSSSDYKHGKWNHQKPHGHHHYGSSHYKKKHSSSGFFSS